MKKTTIALLLTLMAICCGCDDFVEKNLENKNVKIIVPADNTKISTATITFWWEKVDGALEYNLQVVSPSFEQVQRLWADTIVADNQFMLSLVPGNFEWRIKALNGNSESDFITAAFSIDSTLNIIDENIILLSPFNNTITNNLEQIFRWSKLYNANDYHFRIIDAAGESLEDVTTQRTETSYNFSADGTYTWSVRGENEISNTSYSSFTLQIDTHKPEPPTLSTPLNDANIVTDSVYFSWSRANDTGSSLYDSLYVFTNENLTNRKLSKKIDNISYGDLLEAGTYYWYVKSCDAAGNISDHSSVFSFIKN